jgi:hypothetical protein
VILVQGKVNYFPQGCLPRITYFKCIKKYGKNLALFRQDSSPSRSKAKTNATQVVTGRVFYHCNYATVQLPTFTYSIFSAFDELVISGASCL